MVDAVVRLLSLFTRSRQQRKQPHSAFQASPFQAISFVTRSELFLSLVVEMRRTGLIGGGLC